MQIPTVLSTYAQWSGILTLVFLVITIIAFIFGSGIRFRLVGATSFMAVIAAGLFALGLGLFVHTAIPGAIHYSLVYDNGNDRVVIAVPPQIKDSEIEPTLRQAASDLFSYGRNNLINDKLTIRMRTVVHPETGVSQPLYLGEVKRSLAKRQDDQMQIEIFEQNLAQLPQ